MKRLPPPATFRPFRQMAHLAARAGHRLVARTAVALLACSLSACQHLAAPAEAPVAAPLARAELEPLPIPEQAPPATQTPPAPQPEARPAASGRDTPSEWSDEEWLSLARVGMTVRVFDTLKQGCMRQGGFKLQPAMAVHEWMQRNRLEELRPQLAELERSAKAGDQLERGAQAIVKRLRGKNPRGDCEAALTLVRLPQSEIRPALLKLQARGRPPVYGAPPPAKVAEPRAATAPPSAAKPPAPPTGSLPDELLAQVDRFGFDARPTLTAAGGTPEAYPVLLFKDGMALTRLNDLTESDDLATLRGSHPDSWAPWRVLDDQIQLQSPQGHWQRLAYRHTHTGWPDGLKLDASFTQRFASVEAARTNARGLTSWQTLQFNADGTLLRDRGPGHASAQGRRGRYRIEGILLKVQFEDGSTARHVFILDPNDIRSPIWLDGVPYLRDRP